MDMSHWKGQIEKTIDSIMRHVKYAIHMQVELITTGAASKVTVPILYGRIEAYKGKQRGQLSGTVSFMDSVLCFDSMDEKELTEQVELLVTVMGAQNGIIGAKETLDARQKDDVEAMIENSTETEQKLAYGETEWTKL